MLLLQCLPACLINEALYQRRLRELADEDGDGFAYEDECDDGDATVHPSAVEVCNNIDDDCDGAVDEDATDAREWYRDGDGDGFGVTTEAESACEARTGYVAQAGDCDDERAEVYPGAPDTWHDGVDSDCAGDDDFDQDGDGESSPAGGGQDCADDDADRGTGRPEGWSDLGIDNDCDGSASDQLGESLQAAAIGSLVGDTEGIELGRIVAGVPAGIIDDRAWLLAGTPLELDGAGRVRMWAGGTLAGAEFALPDGTLDGEPGDFFGFGLAWTDGEVPSVWLSADGADAGRGAVLGWAGESFAVEEAPERSWRVEGAADGAYSGYRILSGFDWNLDGLDDLVIANPGDSRRAAYAGSVSVFELGDVTEGDVPASAVDGEFWTEDAGAALEPQVVGDVDGDGADDLAFTQWIAYPEGPGGAVVTARHTGTADVAAVAEFTVDGGPFSFSVARDVDADGSLELFAASGSLHRFDLPLRGTLTPWDHATDTLGMADSSRSISRVETRVSDWPGASRILVTSSNLRESAGALAAPPAGFGVDTVDALELLLSSDEPDDAAGADLATADFDGDGFTDIAVGAPGRDEGGSGAGAIYLLSAPE